MPEEITITRRGFLQVSAATAGGLLLGFNLPAGGRFARAAGNSQTAINAWLRIGSDDTITVIVGSSEMGQGVYTSLPMLIAEELDVDWNRVKGEMAPANPTYNNRIFNLQGTGGSTSIRASFDFLREAGASAREMLRQAAAKEWGVPLDDCVARNGYIVQGDRRASYGSLAQAAAKIEPPAEVELKMPAQWRYIGKAMPRLDTPAKVNGSAEFGIDVQIEGMLVATVGACPVFGGNCKSIDEKPALAVKGVRAVVPLLDALIVVADGYWSAKKGLEALKPEWDKGEAADLNGDAITEEFRAGLEEMGAVARDEGDAAAAIAAASRTVDALYEVPYLAHATMEPMNATAHVRADGVDIWAPTQAQGPSQHVVSQMLGLKPEQVQVHTTFLGGGFGRRFELDFVLYAVQASKAVGAPVKVVWSREEDMRHDFYRPAALGHLRAGLDVDGKPVALESKLVCSSIMTRVFPDFVKNGVDPVSVEGVADTPYGFANMHAEYIMKNTAVPVGFWRSVGNSQNAFFMESFMDELAHATKQDPLNFRLNMLSGKPRYEKVLQTAATAGQWGKPAPSGRARGVALHESFGSIVAEVAEISLDGPNIRVHKVACAVDCGRTVNPDTVMAQMESSIAYGLTAALFGEINVENGGVKEGNFDTYRMLKLAEMPAVDVRIIESGAELGGIGEPALPPIAPAVANAVFALTGKRLRKLPLRLDMKLT
ncbi:MAG: molybdopterin cofactor-binding domain-containing protein [Gammaproteobacteria bacterium]